MGALDGKSAVVTGAGGGVGRAYALMMASEGAHVIVNDLGVDAEGQGTIDAGMAHRVVAEIEAAGGIAVANRSDVSDIASAQSIVSAAVENFGSIDILVNNAGIFRERGFGEMSLADWNKVIDVHLHGSFYIAQKAYQQMVVQGRGGVIINTASRTALRGKELQANYAAAKGALISLTQTIALEGRAHGIRAHTILPRGATRGWEQAALTSAGPMNDKLRRHFTLDAPALALLYLVSDRAAAHTGKTVFASADRIAEVRWESVSGVHPTATTTIDDLAAAAADGTLFYASGCDPNRIA